MTDKSHITLERVSQLLDYCPDTGIFTWKPRGIAKFDNRFANKNAGTLSSHGYLCITIDYVCFRANRIAYLFMTGKWPDESHVDHINGIKTDNKWTNLRLATTAQNMQNVGKYSSNTSGYKGVTRRKNGKPYEATIMAFGKYHYLGTYDTPEEAHAAYCKAAAEMHGEFSRVS